MACSRPIQAYQLASGEVVFYERTGRASVRSLLLPCGQCARCRLERSRQWAVRCMHEASLYARNCCVTLTYSEENLPEKANLHYPHFQLFMKRLRAQYSENTVRFYMCGEYGESLGRPHYHALLFNHDFDDKLYFKRSAKDKFYTSSALAALWPYGTHLIGSASFEAAAYIARYCMEKVNGPLADSHYRCVDSETGEVSQRVPEFNRMSLRPGIGAKWFERFESDVYPRGKVVVRGRESGVPRYYRKLLERSQGLGNETLSVLELQNYRSAVANFDDNTDERLAVKEHVALARLKLGKRSLT